MYICLVLLYRCYLSVYSLFLLSLDVHPVKCLMPVCGEVGLKPCASCVLTQSCEYLRITWTTDNQMYKMCLVSNRPTTSSSSSTLGTITQSHWSQLLFHLGSVRSICSDTVELAQTIERVHCALIQNKNLFDSLHQLTRHRLNLWHLSSLSTNSDFHHAEPSRY